jgi:hypothetical protein
MGLTVTPREEMYRWPRAAVAVTREGGLRNLQAEFTVDGVGAFGALFGRGDTSAEEVVELLGPIG